MQLPDGTVIPSYLTARRRPTSHVAGSLSDYMLRMGEVVQVIPPSNPSNKGPATKNKQWVYVVNVAFRNGNGSRSVVPYRCTVKDLFGTAGDHFRYSLRQGAPTGKQFFSTGAWVLVLCPNGSKADALIVGAMRHKDDKVSDPETTFLDFVFNGVKVAIDDKGALSLKVPGATKLDGTPDDNRDKNNKGTQVSFGADGSIAITDGNGDTVTVSPKDKSITVTAGDHTTTVEKAWKLKAATVVVEAKEVTVDSPKVNLGGKALEINPLDEVVVGSGIDPFTGMPYKGLGSTSTKVKARK